MWSEGVSPCYGNLKEMRGFYPKLRRLLRTDSAALQTSRLLGQDSQQQQLSCLVVCTVAHVSDTPCPIPRYLQAVLLLQLSLSLTNLSVVYRVSPSPFQSHMLTHHDTYPEKKRRDPETIPALAQIASHTQKIYRKQGRVENDPAWKQNPSLRR